jgi:hypothetical protein
MKRSAAAGLIHQESDVQEPGAAGLHDGAGCFPGCSNEANDAPNRPPHRLIPARHHERSRPTRTWVALARAFRSLGRYRRLGRTPDVTNGER